MDINLRNCVCVCVCMATHLRNLHVNKWNLSITCMHPVTKPGAECKLSAGGAPAWVIRLREQPGQRGKSSPLPTWLSFIEAQLCSLAHMLSVAAFTPWKEPGICDNRGQRLRWLQGLKYLLSGSSQKYLPILLKELCSKNSVLLSFLFLLYVTKRPTKRKKKKKKLVMKGALVLSHLTPL